MELLYTAYCDMVGLPLPAARHQRYVGVKWIDDRRDVQSALYFFRRGELSVGDWWRSVRGPKWHAVLSRSDPEPFVHDVLQATPGPDAGRGRAGPCAGGDARRLRGAPRLRSPSSGSMPGGGARCRRRHRAADRRRR